MTKHLRPRNQAVLLRMLHRFDLLVPLTTRHALPSNVVPPERVGAETSGKNVEKVGNITKIDLEGRCKGQFTMV